MKFSVVDLFAGAGGLSLGFEQTGQFEIKAAIEKNAYAAKTFIRNHPKVKMYEDVCHIDYKKEILDRFNLNNIDVVIGGPPCQGFSNANRQKNHAISQNNMLVKQYIRAIIELKPSAFVMENVSMLKSNVHRFYMSYDEVNLIKEFKIPTVSDKIELLPKGYYVKNAKKIIENSTEIANYLWDADSYLLINTLFKKNAQVDKIRSTLNNNKNKFIILARKLQKNSNSNDTILHEDALLGTKLESCVNDEMEIEEFLPYLTRPLLTQRMLGKALEILDNKLLVDNYIYEDGVYVSVRSYAVLDYLKSILGSEKYNYAIDCGVLGAADFGAPQKRMRFVVMGIKKSISTKISLPLGKFSPQEYNKVSDAISDLEEIQPLYNVQDDQNGIKMSCHTSKLSPLAKQLRDSETLHNHIITKTRATALERFESLKQGENFHNLVAALKENTYADASRTQNTVYLRLKYNEPSGTVINIRKSMWIHPVLNRAVSVREAARLQTFPDSFVFVGTKDSLYQQVGNAVPPVLSKAIAEKIVDLLKSKFR